MALATGIITFNKKEVYTLVKRVPAEDLNINLPTNLTYEIGIDQSTSCTGIYVQDTSNLLNLMLEVQYADIDKKTYFRNLFGLLRRLVMGVNVSLLVCEKPVPHSSQTYTFRILTELFGKLENFLETEPSLENTELQSIFPSSWKSRVLDKSKGSGRMNQKVCIAEDICDKKPLLKNYLSVSPAKDLDGFDACGILLGYKKCAFTPNGSPQIYGQIEKRHTTKVYYRYLDTSDIKSSVDLRCLLFDSLGETVDLFQPKMKAFNPEYNLIKNIKMASSTYKFTVTVVPKKFLEPLRWEFNLEYDDKKTMFAYVVKVKDFTKSAINALDKIYPSFLEYKSVG